MTTARPIGAWDESACPEYPEEITSLLGVLSWQLEHMPDRAVCHRIVRERRDVRSEPMTVRELVARARAAAARLQSAGVRDGNRVILSLSDPHQFLVAFFATLAAGATAVPLPSAGEAGAPRSFAARVRAVCLDCAPSAAIVDGREAFARLVGAIRPVVLEPRDLDDVAATTTAKAATPALPARLADRPSSSPAFIQYTSGSTGAPKGVVVTHGNILANCRAIRDATAYSRADRMVSWLPLHHDMGLVGGLLTSIYCAAETWLMPPLTFLARPVTWLEAMSRFAATLTVAPTFAYNLCARKIPAKQLTGIDLSSLRLAYVGAEPVDRATVVAFYERFAAYGLPPSAMYPVYGLAEATLAVSFPEPGNVVRYDVVDRRALAADGVAVPVSVDAQDAVSFVSVGHPLPRHRVEIVDRDTGERLVERRVGEVVVEGASISPRYFADEAGTTRTRLRTGDLGYVADGHIYVVDRIKDLVIIGGQNYAPSDLEGAAAEVAGVRRGRVVAFSAPGSGGTEEVHVVAETTTEPWHSPPEIALAVRNRILSDVGLSPASVTLVAPGSLERTSSGKIRRRACADAHRSGTLRVVRTRSAVLAYWLARERDLLLFRAAAVVGRLVAWIASARAAATAIVRDR